MLLLNPLFDITAGILLQLVATTPTGSFVTRSDFNDGFGPIRADRFSIVLYSKYALSHNSSDLNTTQNDIFAKISVVDDNFQQFLQCPGNDSNLDQWIALDALSSGISLDSNVAVYPADMCAQDLAQFSYNNTQISYGKGSEIFNTANNDVCQLWSGIGGDPITAHNATGAGIMRCVLDMIPVCERPGAGKCKE